MRTARRNGAGITGVLGALMAAGLLPACAGGLDEAIDPSSIEGDMDGMKAVAALKLATGQTLEFYDLGTAGLVSESGEAGMPHVFDRAPGMTASHLVSIWEKASPSTPAPSILRKLQDRLMREEAAHPISVARTPTPLDAAEVPIDEVSTPLPDGILAAPNGCNNGCCDYDWLSKFIACGSGSDYHWFYYKQGSSYGKGDDAFHFDAMACAAVGDSNYRVHIQSGGSGTWTLPQGRYRTASAIGGFFDDPNVGSYVNWQMTPKMHSHCGQIWF